ncbi:mycothiol synthase [Streptomyces sp. DvalAA-14]|uniref:mycothiol synthase n=1 Tax=unclassified Streptomyces TaxID=2593676 RepID=UPI00081BA3D6|nr:MULTISPECIES: mycothiol synthase [unclassified Streptomyces]MYS22861.1 mycothiol synthase [Streptomyces sp. SID4948]SCE23571.1 mycothiol synthase [Streptomyces sp. DvalAA-14]
MSDRRIETLSELNQAAAAAVLDLIGTAADADGRPAVSEQGLLYVRRGDTPGVRHLLLWTPREAPGEAADDAAGEPAEELTGYAQLDGTDPIEAPAAEFVVHPARRSHGHGRALGDALMAATGKRLRVWAHGGLPAARHLAAVLHLKLFRELHQMRRPMDAELTGLPEPRLPEGITVRTFVPGQDEAAWLAVNAAAFAHHPEQGGLTQRDLADREAESWFDPAGFFLAYRGAALAGFHWTKVHADEGLGEVYVLGVAPSEQGSGLGKALTSIGLRHLARDKKLGTAMLYVDADNSPAVAVYERMGFTVHETDLMYRTEN